MLLNLFSVEVVTFTIFQYLDVSSQHILHLKLSSSYFESLVNRMVPIHNFMSILHSMLNNTDNFLQIPTTYKIEQRVVPKIVNYFSTNFSECTLPNLITRFVMQYYEHDFCAQVVNYFEYNQAFLYQYSNCNESFGKSKVATEICNLQRVVTIVNSSISEEGTLTIDKKWIEETEWNFNWLLFHIDRIATVFESVIEKNIENQIFENKSLTSFLLRYFYFSNIEMYCHFVELLLQSVKWKQEYKYQFEFFIQLIAFHTENSTKQFLKEELQIHKIENFTEALQLLKANPQVFPYLSPKLHQNKAFVLYAMEECGELLSHINSKLKHDKDVLLAAVKHNFSDSNQLKEIISLYYADDEPFLKQLFIHNVSLDDMTLFPSKFLQDKSLILERVQKNTFASELLRDTQWIYDKEIVYSLLSNNPVCYSNLSLTHQCDTNIILKALQGSGDVIRIIPEQVSITKEMVLIASKTYPFTLLYAIPFQEDEEIVFESIQYFASSLQYVSGSIYWNKEFLTKCIAANGLCLQYIKKDYQQDKSLITIAMKQNAMVFDKIVELQQDEEVFQMAVQFYSNSSL